MNRFIKKYLRDHCVTYFVYLGLVALFLFTFFLYELPLLPFLDSLLFTSFGLLIWTIYDIQKNYRVHRQLLHLIQQESVNHQDYSGLTIGSTQLVQDYQQLLEKLSQENDRLTHDLVTEQQRLLDYYSMWSHQIKTPLAALQVLIETQPDAINQMKNELITIDGYLSMMLHYLKLTNLEQDLILKKVAIYPLVKQVIRKYALFFIQKDLRINLEAFDKEVVTDEKWLVFILEQLIFNSLKYTNQGTISISLKNNALVIEDTGIGILAQDLPRIFESGYTGFNGRSHQKATGLGLHMSREIADKLGITLSITSTVGVGTKVTLVFNQQPIYIE